MSHFSMILLYAKHNCDDSKFFCRNEFFITLADFNNLEELFFFFYFQLEFKSSLNLKCGKHPYNNYLK